MSGSSSDDLRSILSRREYKEFGDRGRLAIVGGGYLSYNPPIIAALTAAKLGVDSLYLMVPEMLMRIRCIDSLTVSVIPLPDFKVTHGVVQRIEKLLDRRRIRADVFHLGPGFTGHRGYIAELVKSLDARGINLVLDSGSLYPEVLSLDIDWDTTIITPHEGEFRMLFSGDAGLELIDYNVVLKRLRGLSVYIHGEEVSSVSHECWPTRYGMGYVISGLLSGLYAYTRDMKSSINLTQELLVKTSEKIAENGCFHTTVEEFIDALGEVIKSFSKSGD